MLQGTAFRVDNVMFNRYGLWHQYKASWFHFEPWAMREGRRADTAEVVAPNLDRCHFRYENRVFSRLLKKNECLHE